MTKLITPKAVLSYEHLFEPTAPEDSNAEPQYSCTLVFEEETDLSDLYETVDAIGKKKWGEEYFSQKKSGDLRLPFRKDKLTERGYPPGSIYINVRSKLSPGIVSRYAGDDGKPERITDPGQIYSGCIVRASLNAFAYDRAGNRGISLGLNNIQKLADGERLDGRLKAEDDFEALDHRTSELDEMLS